MVYQNMTLNDTFLIFGNCIVLCKLISLALSLIQSNSPSGIIFIPSFDSILFIILVIISFL